MYSIFTNQNGSTQRRHIIPHIRCVFLSFLLLVLRLPWFRISVKIYFAWCFCSLKKQLQFVFDTKLLKNEDRNLFSRNSAFLWKVGKFFAHFRSINSFNWPRNTSNRSHIHKLTLCNCNLTFHLLCYKLPIIFICVCFCLLLYVPVYVCYNLILEFCWPLYLNESLLNHYSVLLIGCRPHHLCLPLFLRELVSF